VTDGKQRTLGVVAAISAALLVAGPVDASEGGIQIYPDWRLLGLLVLAFALLIAPVNKLLITPLLRVLDERRERIEGARAQAREVELEAERVLADYRSALEGERQAAAGERQQHIESARREEKAASASAREAAEQQIERARAAIETALGEARATLRRDAEALAREAAERILGRRLA
jgi:F-type H+-transporting ATPase subunit b